MGSKDEIKRQVSIGQVLSHYGRTPVSGKKMQCLLPEKHTNHDANPSMDVYEDRIFCRSQGCFGEKGADIFEVVGRMEGITDFAAQKTKVEEMFNLKKQTRKRTIDQIYTYRDEAGVVLFQTVRYDPKDFRQRQPDGKDGWIWNIQGVRLVLYRLPELLHAESVLIVEGEKDCETAYRLGLPDGWSTTTSPMGAGKWKPAYSEQLKGKCVIICSDADEVGRKHGEKVANSIEGIALEVRRLTFPDGVHDLTAWVERGGHREMLHVLLQQAPEWKPPTLDDPEKKEPNDLRPTIQTNARQLRNVTIDVMNVLQLANCPPSLFARGGTLVRLLTTPTLLAEPMTPLSLRCRASEVADFVRVKTLPDGTEIETPVFPALTVMSDILVQWATPFPTLNRLCEIPVFLSDGRLLAQDGFDAESGVYLSLAKFGPVHHDIPVSEAKDLLLKEVLGDFPLVDDASRAHAVAMILLPFVRLLISGPTPLHLLVAPTRGTGKNLLGEVVSGISQGEPAAVMALTSNNEETEKRITAMLLNGQAMILLDNVTSLHSPALAAALTAMTWQGRRLGESTMIQAPNHALWLATGNNPDLSTEIARRTISIRLDAEQERPEERTDFRHSDLLGWVQANRAVLVNACLSVVQNWINQGMPKGTKPLGKFESWAQTMGGILGCLEVPGFLDDRNYIYGEADEETRQWIVFCQSWFEHYGEHPVTASDVFKVAKEKKLLLSLWGGRSDLSAQQRFGREIRSRRNRIFGTFRLCLAGNSGHGNSVYQLIPISQARTQTSETSEMPVEHQESTSASDVTDVSDVLHPTQKEQNLEEVEDLSLWAQDSQPEVFDLVD